MSSDHDQTQSQGPAMTPEQIKAKLSLYVGSLPSTVIEDLFQTMKSMGLTEKKVEEIIERTIKSYNGQESGTRMDELVDKMNNLEDTLIRALKSIESRQTSNQDSRSQPQEQQASAPAYQMQEESAPAPEQTTFSYEPEPPKKKPGKSRRAPEPEPELEEDLSSISDEPGSSFAFQGHRVLLSDIPESAIANAILLKWVEFLLETVGHQNIPEVLDYYVDIGWISEKVTMKLLAYASGMVAPRGRSKEKLSTKDHLRSLLFIEKLRGRDFDQSKLTRLEREIEYTIEKRIRSD
ncbi:MAG: FlaD/FlaE family flagellar protein [Candidatus Micrarchaeota archaeon]